MDTQIPVMAEKPLTTCGWKKFQLDPLDDHLNSCTTHSGAKKVHDWMVDQIADLFRTTHKVKTQQVVKRSGQQCGDVELVGYLATVTDPVPLVLDLHIIHDRVGSSTGIIPRSWWSSYYRQSLSRLSEIFRMYFDTSLKTSRRD
jgi:hypothetical protein